MFKQFNILQSNDAPLLNAEETKYIQKEVVGKFLYLGRDVDVTLLATLSALG